MGTPACVRVPKRAAELITGSGTITGNTGAASTAFFVGANVMGATQYTNVGTGYSIEVPVGAAFRIAAAETTFTNLPRELERSILAVVLVDSEALTEDTVIDIDLSDPLPLTAISGSADGHQLATMGRPQYVSFNAGFQSFFGLAETISVSDDGASFDYTGQYWMPDGAGGSQTSFSINGGPLNTFVLVEGLGEGVQDVAFLDPGTVVTPAFGVFHPLHDTIVVTTLHEDVNTAMGVTGEDGFLRWGILGPLRATELTIPQLPTGVEESDVLGDTALTGRIQLCELAGEVPNQYCGRQANGRVFDFMR